MITFTMLDKDLNDLITINDLFNGCNTLETGEYDNNPNIIDNSYLSGSTQIGSNRIGSKELIFTGFIMMNIGRYNELLGYIQKSTYLKYDDGLRIGYQKVAIPSAGIAWSTGGFDRGGDFTLTVTLLRPYFESFNESSIDITLPIINRMVRGNKDISEPFTDLTVSLNNESGIASSMFIALEILEPLSFLQFYLVNQGDNLTLNDMVGLGSDFTMLELDSSSRTLRYISADGEAVSATKNLSLDSGFFELPTGLSELVIRADGLVQISSLLLRRRWYI